MSFQRTPEQRALAEAVADVFGDLATGAYARATIESPERWRELWLRLTELDMHGALAPADAGGLGLGLAEAICIAETAGHFLAPVPLVATMSAFVPVVSAAGLGDPAAGQILRRVVADGVPAALVWTNPSAAGERAILSNGNLTLRSEAVPYAGRAELFAVPAVEDGRPVVVVASAGTLGVAPASSMDETLPIGRVDLREHPLDGAIVLHGDPARGMYFAVVAAAAELVGLAAELVARTVGYASERAQFGTQIGAFQSVKHRLVDSHLAVERARSLVMRAAVVIDAGNEPADEAVHLAKAAAGDAATTAADAAVQLHGGIGITWEHDVSLFYLRARQTSMLLGSTDYHYAQAGALVVESRP
jgi:alkylation response protein AidB-like acyl-CoA dehydrogenase